MSKSILSILFFTPFLTFSQLSIGGSEPEMLAGEVLPGFGTQIMNVQSSGNQHAMGYFQANVLNMPFTSGVLMTTGTTFDVPDGPHTPNDRRDAGFHNNSGSYQLLSDLIGGETFNATVLEFDFIPSADSLKLRYIFGSDEYPEYVGTKFDDVFAIFISGPGYSGLQNIAVLPENRPVAINNVNGGNSPSSVPYVPATNPALFVYNGDGMTFPYSSTVYQYLQYDGLTKPLTARAHVIPGETYHLILTIADVGDGIFDSGAFIEAYSLTAGMEEEYLNSLASVFPNPATGELTIHAEKGNSFTAYEIADVYGNIVQLAALSGDVTTDISELASGVYFVRLIAPSGIVTKKIQKL